jgi:hypothetical protein
MPSCPLKFAPQAYNDDPAALAVGADASKTSATIPAATARRAG